LVKCSLIYINCATRPFLLALAHGGAVGRCLAPREEENGSSFSEFPYACPEPVLVT
jgi:hypothetical protein